MWNSSFRLKDRYFSSGREAWESMAGQGIIVLRKDTEGANLDKAFCIGSMDSF
jgi:hypothetical protein